MTRSDSRPLLPSDESHITSQLERRVSEGLKAMKSGEENIEHAKGHAMRSSSNWSLADSYLKRPETLQKALTDTNNFIEMYNSQNRKKAHGGIDELSEDLNGDMDSDQITLEEERSILVQNVAVAQPDDDDGDDEDEGQKDEQNRSDSESGLEHEMELDPQLKKRREEWAERGAAKIVREVTNPNTGVKTREVMKKGIKDFKFGETLGDGSYSTVILATSKESGKKYALKVLNKEYLIRQKKVKYVNIEKNALQRLNNSQGVVKLFFTFQDESSLYFLLQYAPNGDFLSVIKKFGSLNEDCACYYSAQIIDAIDYIHSKGIIHRDIKPENILLDKDMKVKLTDFGTAKILEPKPDTTDKFDLLTRSKSFVGTAEYVSPELLNDSYVDYRCDIWAFGCILFQMIAGKPPFKATNEYLTFQKVMKVQYAFTAGFPLIVRDIVKKILMKQPDQRPSISQIKKHYFFDGKDFSDGSIWAEPAPEIQPYKISAKSMQAVPALSSGAISQPKRPVVIKAMSKTPSNIQLNGSDSKMGINNSKSPSTPTLPLSTSKKALDERTAQILNNARKAVGSRKQTPPYKKAGSGAALAASAALTKKNKTPPPPAIAPPTSSNSIHGNIKIKSSSTSRTTTLIGLTANNAVGPANSLNASRKASSSSVFTGGVNGSDSETPPLPAMSKIDVMWSYFLKNIEERVLAAAEIDMSVVETDWLERRIQRMHGSLMEPQSGGTSRGTLLSQVARGGGGVTGFRTESNNMMLPENMYYDEMLFEYENISKDYRRPGGDAAAMQQSGTPTPSSASSKTSVDDNGNLAITDKFKKLFHHSNKIEPNNDTIHPNEFFKKMLVVTSLGRALIFVKKTKKIPDTNLFFELVYDINLCQSGTKLKEIILPSPYNDDYRSFTIQTPYKSFVFKGNSAAVENWLGAINKGIKFNHERLIAKSKKEDEQKGNAIKAARLASPTLARENSTFENADSPLKAHQFISKTPKTPKTSASASNSPVISSSPTGRNNSSVASSTAGSAKGSRLFDHFVNSKERTTKKHATPVPIPTKLVNGLPSSSIHSSVGLGISEPDLSGAKISSSRHLKKTIIHGNSKWLSRSETSFRTK